MIDFELTPEQKEAVEAAHKIAEEMFRPISRYYDEHEHESPKELIDKLWERRREGSLFGGLDITAALRTEEICWGDAGLYLCVPSSGSGRCGYFCHGDTGADAAFSGQLQRGWAKMGRYGDDGGWLRFGHLCHHRHCSTRWQ